MALDIYSLSTLHERAKTERDVSDVQPSKISFPRYSVETGIVKEVSAVQWANARSLIRLIAVPKLMVCSDVQLIKAR